MKRAIPLFSILIVFVIMLGACGSGKEDHSNSLELDEGTYVLSGSEEDSDIKILFDLAQDRFSISVLGNEFMTGTVKIQNEKVTATTDDEKFTYVFQIEDHNKICLNKDESDTLVGVSGNEDILDKADGEFVLYQR
ncbi:hypothetical protein [Oscillibacter ruminantium]